MVRIRSVSLVKRICVLLVCAINSLLKLRTSHEKDTTGIHKGAYNCNNIFIFETDERANTSFTNNKLQRDLNSTKANCIRPV
jgi:hypothetical protein